MRRKRKADKPKWGGPGLHGFTHPTLEEVETGAAGVYLCPKCNKIHIGHRVKRGVVARKENKQYQHKESTS